MRGSLYLRNWYSCKDDFLSLVLVILMRQERKTQYSSKSGYFVPFGATAFGQRSVIAWILCCCSRWGRSGDPAWGEQFGYVVSFVGTLGQKSVMVGFCWYCTWGSRVKSSNLDGWAWNKMMELSVFALEKLSSEIDGGTGRIEVAEG